MTRQEILDYVIEYINSNFGPSIGPITSDTKLLTSRLLDSISTLNMVSHMEEKFNFEAEAHEVSSDNFDSPSIIADYILSKKK